MSVSTSTMPWRRKAASISSKLLGLAHAVQTRGQP